VRIKGLVAASAHVRSRVRAGLGPDDVAPLKERVHAIVRQVEAICAQRGVTPGDLPAPSRMAYAFLRELELDARVSLGADRAPPPIRIGNAVSVGRKVASGLWRQLASPPPPSAAWARLEAELRTHAAAIEQLCARRGATPSALERPSRRVYCWLKYLARESNLVAHHGALRRAQRALAAVRADPDRLVMVHLINTDALWRTRPAGAAVVLTVNEGFLHADDAVWRAVTRCALSGRDAADARLVRAFAASDDFGGVLFDLESAAPPAGSARGRVHDLDERFARVNAAYFAGRMPKPTLAWNDAHTARTFGHYHRSRDTVMLSISLDDPRVPAFVVDFVLYHELLHKQLEPTTVNGRRVAHGRGFRSAERRFADYAEAGRLLSRVSVRWSRAARDGARSAR